MDVHDSSTGSTSVQFFDAIGMIDYSIVGLFRNNCNKTNNLEVHLMKRSCLFGAVCACLSSALIFSSASAAPVTIDIMATIGDVNGSYTSSGLLIGQAMTGTFIYDSDESNADPGAITTPSTVPGHEFTSFYEFSNPSYSVSLSIPAISGSFTNSTPVAVVVNDNLPLTSGETGGLLADGTYDWIEILGSTTTSICLLPGGVCAPDEFSPADGEEWTLALFGNSSWFSDGSVIPDNLPAPLTAIIVGLEFDAAGNEIGSVFAPVGTVTVSAVPVPAAIWLLGSGLLCLVGVARRKKAA